MGSQAALLGMDQSFLKELEPDEIALFNYVYAQKGKDSAYQYLKSISGDLTYRQRKKSEAEWEAYAREHPVGTSVFSVLESPMKGLSYLGQAADYELDKLMSNPEKDSKTFYDDLFRVMDRDYGQYKSVYQDMIEQSWTSGDKLKTAMEDRMAKDLGLDKASSLPVEYSAPGGGSFDQEVRRQLERGGSWKDALPKDSGDLAKSLDGLEPENGKKSVTDRQRIKEIGDSPFSDEAKELSVKRLLGEKELERYNAARKAGISVGAWCRLYEDIARVNEKRTGKSGSASSASQEDVRKALEKSGLSKTRKKAVWDSYGWEKEWDE